LKESADSAARAPQSKTQHTDVTFHCDRFWLKESASLKVSAKLVHLETFHWDTAGWLKTVAPLNMLSIRTTLEVSNVEMSPLNETAFCKGGRGRESSRGGEQGAS
jgi:hypothetical protein